MSDFSDSAANVSEVWLEISIKFDRFRYQILLTSDTEAFAWLFDFCESTSKQLSAQKDFCSRWSPVLIEWNISTKKQFALKKTIMHTKRAFQFTLVLNKTSKWQEYLYEHSSHAPFRAPRLTPHLQLLTTTPLSNAPSTKSVNPDDDMCHFCYLKSFSTQSWQCLSPSVLSNRLCICFCENNDNVNKVQGINYCPFQSSIHKSSGLFYNLQRRRIALAIFLFTSHHNPTVCHKSWTYQDLTS